MATLIKTETGRKSEKYLYQVIDRDGEVLSERRSNRDYVACTVGGEYYFGRIDLIGKGDHGRSVKYWLSRGEVPPQIAYLTDAHKQGHK